MRRSQYSMRRGSTTRRPRKPVTGPCRLPATPAATMPRSEPTTFWGRLGEHAADHIAPHFAIGYARVGTQQALPARVAVLVVEEAPVSSTREKVVASRQERPLPQKRGNGAGQAVAFGENGAGAVIPSGEDCRSALSSSSLQSQRRFCAARSKTPEKRSRNSMSPRKYGCVSARSISGLQPALRRINWALSRSSRCCCWLKPPLSSRAPLAIVKGSRHRNSARAVPTPRNAATRRSFRSMSEFG